MSDHTPHPVDALPRTPDRERPRTQARTVLLAALGLLTALAFAVAPGTAQAAEAATGARPGAAATGAEALVTCNYRATVRVNVHATRNRESSILSSWPAGTVFYGAPCTNVAGGNYGSCGTGNLWKAIGTGWVATKCLVRV
ncbi:hypothetical protein DPM19_01365 [Actinomadura craniellae]|uniref:SH3 domain-containing protein n=1 Tax=Actinomadura craniellae TaxID=2231787 RepID=A0A365HFB6_9ACTN|nr:hypothetical protein [Actinomadura craniellae]RAY16843.1 hypothetical protein DPM19_01365 [Actinomadura craniellae]